ncbi:hypothetical protein ACFLRP_01365 [Bacteroidota bacterium]
MLDVPSLGWAGETMRLVNETLGLPSGCAPANAVYTWEKAKSNGKPAFQAAAASALATTCVMGASFIFYGSLENATWVYPAVATANAITAYGARLTGARPASETHPLYRIF